ncbi:MAG TPA: ABC transporter permease [Vicinamibacterales bacterium]|nr:ABC transporter permease [Vicinamibacterales bacterium]
MDRADEARLGAAGVQPVTAELADTEEVDLIPVRTYWQLVRQRFMRHRLAVIALVVLAILVAAAIIVPTITGDQYQRTNLRLRNAPITLTTPLGTNELGQDIFLRLMRGTQISLAIGLAAVVIIAGIGTLVGAIAGYAGGVIDNILMRVVDIVLSLPVLFIILMVVAFFGRGDMWVIVIAIGITGWTLAARLIRAEFLRLREADFVQAARALGAHPMRIAARHMLPSALAPIIVASALGVADSVVTEAALSFLGFGISPPEASLGNMLTNAREYFFRRPEFAFYPGIVLILIVLCASFLGDGLRDALDPRQRVEK